MRRRPLMPIRILGAWPRKLAGVVPLCSPNLSNSPCLILLLDPIANFGMSQSRPKESRRLRQAIAEARALLQDAHKQLQAIIQDETMIGEIPVEADAAIESGSEAIAQAVRRLGSTGAERAPSVPQSDGPTPQQRQFLGFIREYMMRN